jgi:hypothetical protein
VSPITRKQGEPYLTGSWGAVFLGVAIAGCQWGLPEWVDASRCRVVRVLDCTAETGNWFSGRHVGECRVELNHGGHATVRRPVSSGDDVIACCPEGYGYHLVLEMCGRGRA